jgi:hypothetical protein
VHPDPATSHATTRNPQPDRFICYHPDGRRVRLLTSHVVGVYDTARLITVPQRLPRLLDCDPVIVVWDSLPAHRSTDVKTWLATQTAWLHTVRLPGYAPDLNPVEHVVDAQSNYTGHRPHRPVDHRPTRTQSHPPQPRSKLRRPVAADCPQPTDLDIRPGPLTVTLEPGLLAGGRLTTLSIIRDLTFMPHRRGVGIPHPNNPVFGGLIEAPRRVPRLSVAPLA